MAAFFIDLDGTFFQFGTNIPLPGAVDIIRGLLAQNHQIIFTTRRSDTEDVRPIMKKLFNEDLPVIPNVQSPRIVINDDGAGAINHPVNSSWNAKRFSAFL